MWDGVAWKQVSHPQERRGVSRESLGRGGSKGVATQAWNHPLIQEVEEGGGAGTEEHAETSHPAPRKVLENQPQEPRTKNMIYTCA